jgi:hypothetical protein
MLEGENATPETAPAADSGEINVDHLLSEIEAGRDPNAEAPEGEAAAAAEPVWNGSEWEFEWNGKKVVPESPDKLKIWASQGYNYSQRMGELNKTHAQRMSEAEARERQAQELEQKFSPYVEIDRYAQENKDWWDHVQNSFKNRETHGVDPSLAKILNPLQEELGQIKQFVTQQQQAAQQAAQEAQYQQEDQALDAEIDSIRKSHPNIDLSARDESGETLERRVMLHAQEIGTHSFRAAFRDYLHDKLVVQQQVASKVQAVRGTQAQAKAGLLGTTQAPTKQLKPVDTRVPWSDPSLSVEAVLNEFRQTGG